MPQSQMHCLKPTPPEPPNNPTNPAKPSDKLSSRMKYRTTDHSVYNLNYHIVLVTKYRNKVLSGPVEAFLKTQMYHICATYGWEILALEVMPDLCTLRREVASFICSCPSRQRSRLLW
jgi:hypothetical protein